jgi:N-acetyl-alpha-D-muramate 1-phosphate uridylyltransferase
MASFGCRLVYSYEPEPLESGGGIATASAFFSNALIIVASADIYSNIEYKYLSPFSDISWGDDSRGWFEKFDAHFVLIPAVENEPGHEFALGENQLLNEGRPRQTLANISVLKTELCQSWTRGTRFKLLPHYREWVAKQRVSGELFQGLWCNVTTMADVEKLNAL